MSIFRTILVSLSLTLFIVISSAPSPVLAQQEMSQQEADQFSALLQSAQESKNANGLNAAKDQIESAAIYGTALLEKYPSNANIGYGLAYLYDDLGRIAANQNDMEGAERNWTKAIGLFQWLYQANQNNIEIIAALANTKATAGMFAGSVENYPVALKLFNEAVDHFTKATNLTPDEATKASLQGTIQAIQAEIQKVEGKLVVGVYDGDMVDGVKEGFGILNFPDGARYTGFFAANKYHGQGNLRFPNGQVNYKGTWKDGKRNGEGLQYYDGGNYYTGEWLNDQPSGKGYFLEQSSKVYYDGDWLNGERNGQGKQGDFDGNSYVGSFVDNKQNGYGVYTRNNGDMYEGEWQNNQRHGHGRHTYADGRFCAGNWAEGYLVEGQGRGYNGHGRCYLNDYGIITWDD